MKKEAAGHFPAGRRRLYETPPQTHVDGHAVVQTLPNHRLPLDVDVLPVLDGQRLDEFAVQVQRHRLGLHAQGDLVPVAVKQVVDAVVLEHGPHGVLRQAHGVVLHRFVLAVQADGHLSSRGGGVSATVLMMKTFTSLTMNRLYLSPLTLNGSKSHSLQQISQINNHQ